MRRIRRPSPRRPGNLPAPLDRFVGRGFETARLGERLAGARLVTVTGAGGVGKSRLALRTAERVQNRFSGGVWLITLSEVRNGALLGQSVAEALGLACDPARPPGAVLRQHFAHREALLVLDGCERLADACAALSGDLLRRAPGLRILATSRCPLETAGEQVFPLGPMAVDEAVALFEDRAAAVAPQFDASAARPGAVRDLCRRLDGLPLAVELAAGRLRVLSVGQIAQRVEGDRFRLLSGGERGGGRGGRHATLRTAIGWSHELCGPEERLLWARLSVFGGGFDLEAAEYLCAGEGLAADRVLPVLDALVAQSVVVREEREGVSGAARYRLLESVRAYGAVWTAELGEVERLRQRHRDWYLGLGTWCELDWFGPRQSQVAARVEAELPNLRLALEHSLRSAEDTHIGQHLAATLWFCWLGCGHLAEGRHWLDRALAAPGGRPDTRAKALWVSAQVFVLQGQAGAALDALRECLELAADHEDATATAHATQVLGSLAVVRDDTTRAQALLGEAVERFRDLGALGSLPVLAQVQLAMVRALEGDTDAAGVLGEEARRISAGSGERWALSYALHVLAYVHMERGEVGRARALAIECLTIKREFGDVPGMAMALEVLAPLSVGEAPERAAEMLGAAVAGWRSVGARRSGSRLIGSSGSRCRQAARDSVGESAYAAAYRRGRDLGLLALVEREIGVPPGARSGAAPRRAGRQETGPVARRPAGPPPKTGADGGRAD